MAELTGNTISSTYTFLLKAQTTALTSSLQVIEDGAGNDSALSLSTAGVASTGTFAVTGVSTLSGDLRLEDDAGGEYFGIGTPATVTSYTLTVPDAVGSSGQALRASDGAGTLEWYTPEDVGDITKITAGDGISGGGDSGDVTVAADLKADGGLVIESEEIAVDLAASSITGTLAVGDGGTGATTLTDGGVLLGSGTNAVTATAVLADGEILIGDGSTDPVALDVGSSTAITILGTVATGVWGGTAVADAYVADDLTISGGTVNNSIIGGTTAAAGTFTQVDVEAEGDLRLQDSTGGEYVAIQSPSAVTSYTLTMPAAVGGSGQVLETSDATGTLAWVTRQVGDITKVTAGDGISGGGESGDVSVAADLKANGGLVIESEEIAVDLAATSFTNTLANASLANSAVTIGSTSVSLGATVTTFVGLASVTSTAFVGDLTGTSSLVTVTDSTADTDFPVVFNDESNALLDDTGAFTYNPDSSTVTATTFSGALTGDITGDVKAADGAVAFNSGTDVANSSIANGVTATTQSASDASTKVATTAYVDAQVATENELAEMNDVNFGVIDDANLIVFDGTSDNKWENVALSGDGTITYTGALSLAATNTNLTTLENVTTVGKIGAGEWEGETIALGYGGTGLTAVGTANQVLATNSGASAIEWQSLPVEIGVACSDETSVLTTGNNKVRFMIPEAMTLTEVKASLVAADTDASGMDIDVRYHVNDPTDAGATVFDGGDLNIAQSAFSGSESSLSVTALGENSFIMVDINGPTTPDAKGLKVWLIGTRA